MKTSPPGSLEMVNAVIGSPGAQLNSNPTVVPYASWGLVAGNSAGL